jgi:hypothetical protein
VRVATASGRLLPKVQPAFAITAGNVARLTGPGSIECGRRGDARLRITAGAATSEVTVQCRPIRYIVMREGLRHSVDLVAGADPVPLDIGAVGTDGRPLETIAVAAVVRDTSIAIVRDGLIYPRNPGRTIITLNLGCQTYLEVTVHARAATSDAMQPHEMIVDTITLAGEDHRFWKLPSGQYAVNITGDTTALPSLSTFAADCRGFVPGEYTCKAQPGAALIVRPAKRRKSTTGAITIIRTDGPPLPLLATEVSREIARTKKMCAESF